MAQNKSHNQFALLMHVLVYGVVLATGLYFMMPKDVELMFFGMYIAFNVSAHGFVDMITSKITSYLYQKQRLYFFFVTIGFDQLIHTCTLIASFQMFFNEIDGVKWLLR